MDAHATDSTRRLNAELLRLISAQVCIHATMAGMRMAAPLLALQQGYSAAAVGVLLALFALTQVFLALPAGRFADRHGLHRPLAWCVGVACGGAGLAVIWPHYLCLCVAALCTGGAAGAAVIALQRHVGRLAEGPTELKRVFSWLSLGPAVSNFVGPFLAGLMIDHLGFRAAFALMAALPLLAWAWLRSVRALPAVAVPPADQRRPAWSLLRDEGFRRLLLLNWFLSSCWDVHTFVVPILGHERGLSASVIGALLGAFAVSASAVRLLLPWFAERVREWAVIMSAMLATALLFAVYPLLQGPWAMGLCSVLAGFALGAVQPMIMSTLHQITPHDRHGEALGLRLMTINASSVMMPMLFGSAGALVGIGSVFWASGALVGLGSRLAWGMRHAQLPAPTPPPPSH
ncbi:MFS transporter [Curvibacter sp. HBC61]|uniref:MFS transporter n=1 Tax=Curvibacter cyanobacteriorum TaxID=3026422 RepID=A0ABT5MZ85_9BURK|nr:MFS transporter [Curvibacter sp. HBC61]MDD0838659.1 MFS transporter [Curvibacter sp. HBC61]